jgi:sugar lactone lactonase YvrE
MSEGTGTSVRFNTPLGLANDGTYLYVADAGNHRIRRLVISSATSSLLAGSTAGFGDGTGAGASFNQPQDVAVFGSYVYVADMSNHAVRRVDASTGSTLTVAGNGVQGAIDSSAPTSARFNSPAGIATVGSDVWVADTSNHAIRRFAGGAGAVSTPAGPLTVMPTSLFSDGVGAAVGMQGGGGVASDDRYLYFTDFSNHTLRKLDRNSGAVTTLAGLGGSSGVVDGTGNSARFNLPAAVTVDGDFLYVMHGHAIRRVDKVLGVVTTVAGSAISGTNDGTGVAARFSNPSQAVVVGGMLYMADQLNHSIRRVDLSSQVVDTFAGTSGLQGTTDNVVGNAARFNWPSGLATDGKFLYVADLLNYAVRKIDLSTQMVTTLVGAVGVSGTTDGIGPAARMSGPATLAMDAENRYLYCYDYATRVIRRIELATAEVTTVSGNLGPRAEIDSSWANSLYDGLTAGMAVTPDGLYIMSARGLRVAR